MMLAWSSASPRLMRQYLTAISFEVLHGSIWSFLVNLRCPKASNVRLGLLPLRVLVGILRCCNVFKPGGSDRLDAYGTGGTCGFDAFSAQAMVYRWDHPCRHENCDKLHVPDDLQFCGLTSGVMHLTWPSITLVYDSERSKDAVTFKPTWRLQRCPLDNVFNKRGCFAETFSFESNGFVWLRKADNMMSHFSWRRCWCYVHTSAKVVDQAARCCTWLSCYTLRRQVF